jgi:cell division septal protein FtsQ
MKTMGKLQAFFRQRSKRVLLIAIVFAALVFVAAIRWQNSRSITRVNVLGTTLIRQSEIVDIVLQNAQDAASKKLQKTNQVLNVPTRLTKNDINTNELEQRIEKHPFVKRASAFIGASDALTIEVEERKPIAYLMMKGKQYYLDAEARILPYRLTETVLDLPIIAAQGRTKPDSAKIAEVMLTLAAIQEFDKAHEQSLYQSLSEIDVFPNGEFQFRLTDFPTPIRFGSAEQKELKIKRLAAFLQHCTHHKISLDDCKYVDVRWEHQVVIMPQERYQASAR